MRRVGVEGGGDVVVRIVVGEEMFGEGNLGREGDGLKEKGPRWRGSLVDWDVSTFGLLSDLHRRFKDLLPARNRDSGPL